MATTYRDWGRRIAPPILRDNEWGERLLGLLTLVTDMVHESIAIAIYARSLTSSYFPEDALRHVGNERGMPRYPGETSAQYRLRLLDAWSAWGNAGTAQAVKDQLALAGLDDVSIHDTHDWDWDGNDADWSRFWVLVKTHPFPEWILGDGYTLGQGRVIGLTATPGDVAFVRGIVRRWRAAHVRCQHIIFLHAGIGDWNAQLPDGTWDDETNRNIDAAYVPG